ncbi:MAG: glutaminyl-peptide cyclotransferase [Marinifilaceae bacterium]|jgi:glutamine cyclotransferase|nr:glutaminyl-peptide cyclotransferase [Marinifilaceae bacterium]
MTKQLLINLSILISVALFSCSNKKSNSHKSNQNKINQYINSLRLKSPRKGDLYSFGKEININIHARKRSGDIDSMILIADGDTITRLTKPSWNYKWIPSKNKMGKYKFDIIAYHENGEIGKLSSYINIKSRFTPKSYKYKVKKEYKHDKTAYTQGLFFHNGYLYEGTGQNGQSELKKIDLKTGKLIKSRPLEDNYFGEGICMLNDNIYQLTWTSKKAFVIDAKSFKLKDTLYPKTSSGQSWGIINIENNLVISDGTNKLQFVNPQTFEEVKTLEVYDNLGKVTNINEMEYIDGKIYANIWLTDKIIVINPDSGAVEAEIDLSNILDPKTRSKLTPGDDVLNGIAYDKENNRIFVTGKRWPKLFEIEIEK